MGTLFDYLNQCGGRSFFELPPNEVDSLILSLISYVDPEEIVPTAYDTDGILLCETARAFFQRHPDPSVLSLGLILPREIFPLFRAAGETRRFGELRVKGYRNEIDPTREMQFSAITFVLPDKWALVAYRGTDDTLIGWKEDFNLAYLPIIPSQEEAAAYLNAIAPYLPEDLYVTGHSKGANLAVWASFNCDPSVRARLRKVWSNDGPGFAKGTLTSPAYLEMRPIMQFVVPQDAVVGTLLEHDENYQVIESDREGLYQHNGLLWKVEGCAFVRLEAATESSRQLTDTVNEWLDRMTAEEREGLMAALFRALTVHQATTLTELSEKSAKKGPIVRLILTDREVRRAARRLLALLAKLKRQSHRAERAKKAKK